MVYYLFVPDRTVYEIDSGSYFVAYNSFKQTRKPVLLMYYKEVTNKTNKWCRKMEEINK